MYPYCLRHTTGNRIVQQTPSCLNFYVHDVEKAHAAALRLGAVCVTNITTLWFGDRVCSILDPFGNLFWINQRIEELDFTNSETAKRAVSDEATGGINYIQQSLNQAMKTRNKFLTQHFRISDCYKF